MGREMVHGGSLWCVNSVCCRQLTVVTGSSSRLYEKELEAKKYVHKIRGSDDARRAYYRNKFEACKYIIM
jgi:hypothetical protein